MNLYNIKHCDALIIGAGVSGMLAAREIAANENNNVIIISTGKGASPYIHGFNMPLHPDDSEELFLSDMIKSGREQSDPVLAKTLCRGALPVADILAELNIQFDRKGDGYSLLRPLGASVPRVASAGNHTGVSILNALKKELSAKKNVTILDNFRALKLVSDGRKVYGAITADMDTRFFTLIAAKATVLAAGGFCNIFPFSTNTKDIGGDSIAMAYDAGAKLTDMEFVQFEPSAAVAPAALRGKSVITTMYFEGAVLKNTKGERFMLNYSDKGECVDKDVQAKCIYREIAEGRGTENGGVFFDATGVGKEKLLELYPSYVDRYKAVGIDISETPFEIAPAPHTSLGGVMINPDCSVKALSGLFACGEAIGGLHGANRIGGNAGLETLVFGSLAGKTARSYLDGFKEECDLSEFYDEISAYLGKDKEGTKATMAALAPIREEMEKALSENCSVIRSGKGLLSAISAFEKLQSKLDTFATDQIAFETEVELFRLKNDVTAALLLAKSAYERKESIGCHVRSDSTTENCNKYRVVISKADDGVSVTRCDI